MPETCGFFGENARMGIEYLDRCLLGAQRLLLYGNNTAKSKKEKNKENTKNLAQKYLIEETLEKTETLILKERLHCKLYNIPVCYQTTIKTVRNISISHINHLVVIKGTALRCAARKNRETSKEFKCGQCGYKFMAYTDLYQFNDYKMPSRCKNTVERQKSNLFRKLVDKAYGKNKGKKGTDESKIGERVLVKEECGCKSFASVENTASYVDYQEIRLQETFRTLKPGVIPRAIVVILQVNAIIKIN